MPGDELKTAPPAAGPDGEEWNPRIVALCCKWCSYAGADLAGSSRLKYPSSVRIVRVPCSGRVDPMMVIKALVQGADGVMVLGCHLGDCHYRDGNYYCERRLKMVGPLLQTVAVDPRRLALDWCSASEGERFQQMIINFTEQVRRLGPIERFGLRFAADAAPDAE